MPGYYVLLDELKCVCGGGRGGGQWWLWTHLTHSLFKKKKQRNSTRTNRIYRTTAFLMSESVLTAVSRPWLWKVIQHVGVPTYECVIYHPVSEELRFHRQVRAYPFHPPNWKKPSQVAVSSGDERVKSLGSMRFPPTDTEYGASIQPVSCTTVAQRTGRSGKIFQRGEKQQQRTINPLMQ